MQFLPEQGFKNNKKLFCEAFDSANQFSEYENYRFTEFNSIHQTKSYVPIIGHLLEHIITCDNLSSLEKLYYIKAESLASINAASGKQRAVALSSNKWAAKLGCSKSKIFAMQKKLVGQGYFVIARDKNKYSQDKRNLITPTVPDSTFEHLCNSPNKPGIEDFPYNNTSESKPGYLHRTKLFIPLNYKLLSLISSCLYLTPSQKIIWLDFYARSYKSYVASGKISDFSFFTSYQELVKRYNCGKSALSKIMDIFEGRGFAFKKRIFRKQEQGLNDRQDQSIWQITLGLPTILAMQLLNSEDRKGLKTLYQSKVEPKIDVDNSLSDEAQTEGDFIDAIVEELTATEDEETGADDDAGAGQGDSNKSINTGDITTSYALSKIINKPTGVSTEESQVSCNDPHVANSSPYINKNILLNNIFKSNLEQNSEVPLNFSSENVFKNKFIKKRQLKLKKQSEFNICSELIRKKLKALPKDKADKARKYAYALSSKKLAKGYASTIGKHELAKQLLFHAATWKPKQYSYLSTEDQIDVALATAWKAVENGTWKAPLGWAKAQILQYEFQHYKDKYQKTGILSSHEITELEKAVSNLLEERFYGTMEYKITLGNSKTQKSQETEDNYTCYRCQGHSSEDAEPQNSSEDYIYQSEDYYNHLLVKEGLVDEEHRYYSEDDIATKTDLSSLPDEQRQIILTPSDEKGLQGIIFETFSKKQYLLNVKSFETNIYGDTVMVLERTGSAVLLKNQNSDAANSSIVDVSIDDFLNNIKHIDTDNTNSSNVIETGKNYLGQAQKLKVFDLPEYFHKDSPDVFFTALDIDDNIKVADAYNNNGTYINYIDFSKMLDEE